MGQPARIDDQELYYSDMAVGEILRRARMHHGRSLVDIERALRIRASQLEAIETGDFEKLPGKVYAIGFIRSYAEYLGLDGDQMVHVFKSQANNKQGDPALHFPVGASDSKLPSLWLVLISCALFVGVMAFWWSDQLKNRDLVETITITEQDLAEVMGPPKPESRTVEAATDAETAPAETPEDGITLNITQNSWVEIKDQTGEQIVSRVLKKGEVYFVPQRPDLFMSLGNAAGVSLEIDGETLKPLGKRGEIMRNIPLDRNYLSENFSSKLD